MDNIICIAGPTASGKTALAVELAKEAKVTLICGARQDQMRIYADYRF